jgi:hypothetical protein
MLRSAACPSGATRSPAPVLQRARQARIAPAKKTAASGPRADPRNLNRNLTNKI